jgi:hypothetical protein
MNNRLNYVNEIIRSNKHKPTRSKNKMQNKLSTMLKTSNMNDNNFELHSLICGSIAPHQISGQLGHGSASSGFINYNLYSNISQNDITFHVK